MRLRHVTFRDACEFIAKHHRHHKPPQGHIVSIGCEIDGELHGVATIGRPVARRLDDGKTAEVTRLCCLPTPNVASWLLARAKRLANAMGYTRVVTYTLDSESGSSLLGAGWTDEGPAGGGSWSKPSRPRNTEAPTCVKRRWSAP